LLRLEKQDVDARDKRGHDDDETRFAVFAMTKDHLRLLRQRGSYAPAVNMGQGARGENC
jgi:hypothetical protein